ncbi:MAG: hypothetical protein R3251_03660 [Candidatus Spechtbacterales bacterium]|nr:hypothetical protein [Candidatus Spechtbacterales bacterium]
MKKVLNIYKPIGFTPLQAVEKFKEQNPKYKDVKMTYAGRLDPMAEGVLLVLVDKELKEQRKYWELDKEYIADILFGFSTDTYDILGLVNSNKYHAKTLPPKTTPDKAGLNQMLNEYKGTYTFQLPPYSSKRIKGKPLFWWARRNRLNEIEIPQKTVQIYEIELLDTKNIKKEILEKEILKKLEIVKGDFRQNKIKNAWKKAFKHTQQKEFLSAQIRIKCSSGTYIRSIAHELGQKADTGAVLIGLKRTQVDKYIVENSLKL